MVPKALVSPRPDPGTIEVSIGGLFQWLAGGIASSGQSYGGQKLASDVTQGFARIFLGMAGQASNGVLYGMQSQIRQNFGAPSGGASSATGVNGSTLNVRTAYAYIGTQAAGMLKLGAIGGPQTTFGYGMFDSFNDGAWNGDLPDFIPINVQPVFPFSDSSALYTTDKITYYSPAFSGLDFGVSWEPQFVTLNDATACGAGSLSSCDNLAESDSPADGGLRRNTFDTMVRYRASFGDVGIALAAGYIGGGVVHETSATAVRYRGLSVASVGIEATYAGFTVGGHYFGGAMNGNWSLLPRGGAPANAFMLGAQYEIGPVVLGASFFDYQSQGDDTRPAAEGQRAEYGIAAGGTYLLTPGIGVFLAYLYGQRKQSGYDFLAGVPGALNNVVRSQAAGMGLTVQW